jgi:hypothetical protein
MLERRKRHEHMTVCDGYSLEISLAARFSRGPMFFMSRSTV